MSNLATDWATTTGRAGQRLALRLLEGCLAGKAAGLPTCHDSRMTPHPAGNVRFCGAMSLRPHIHRLSVDDVEVILTVTSKLAAPFDLNTMLAEVVDAAKQVLRAERASVWLYDAATDEMVLRVATDIDRCAYRQASVSSVRARANAGSSTSRIATPTERFNPEVDRASGYRTRCMLTLPLVDHKDVARGRHAGLQQDRRRLRRQRRSACRRRWQRNAPSRSSARA